MALASILSGCVATTYYPPPRAAYRPTGDPIADGRAALAAAPERDRSLHEYRLATAAIRRGAFDEAAGLLDDAIARLNGIVGNPDEAARRSRTLFRPEETKTFVGETYERAMAYYYRGLLYWREGELDNARACFRAAEFADSDAVGQAYRGDYVLFDYLDGLASHRLGGDGRDPLARAAALAKRDLPPYAEAGNVLLFVEFGSGPRKVASGAYGERLQFRSSPGRGVRSATVTVGGQTVTFTPWDDLHYQATTRGGREMDYILGQKAVFKGGADAVGDLALAGAQIAAANIYRPKPEPKPEPKKPEPKKEEPAKPSRATESPETGPHLSDLRAGAKAAQAGPPAEAAKRTAPPAPKKPEMEKDRAAEIAAWTLGTIGVLSKIAAAATMSHADTRTWDNLPQYLSFGSVRLPPGEHEATIEFFDVAERRIDALTRRQVVRVADGGRDTVAILGEHTR